MTWRSAAKDLETDGCTTAAISNSSNEQDEYLGRRMPYQPTDQQEPHPWLEDGDEPAPCRIWRWRSPWVIAKVPGGMK